MRLKTRVHEISYCLRCYTQTTIIDQVRIKGMTSNLSHIRNDGPMRKDCTFFAYPLALVSRKISNLPSRDIAGKVGLRKNEIQEASSSFNRKCNRRHTRGKLVLNSDKGITLTPHTFSGSYTSLAGTPLNWTNIEIHFRDHWLTKFSPSFLCSLQFHPGFCFPDVSVFLVPRQLATNVNYASSGRATASPAKQTPLKQLL